MQEAKSKKDTLKARAQSAKFVSCYACIVGLGFVSVVLRSYLIGSLLPQDCN